MSISRANGVLSVCVVLGLGHAAQADVSSPKVTDPLASWTPVQQWMPYANPNMRDPYGYGTSFGAVVLADELGEHFSELGRASLIEECLADWRESPDAALAWAACGHDVAVLDMKKLEAELVAEKVGADERAQIIARVNSKVASAKKVGAFVEQAAKDDPGIASVVQLGEAARTEWTAFASANREAINRHLALKDAVRSGKTNDKGFEGCYEATKEPFAKIVKATKIPYEVSGHPLPDYFALLMTTTAGYVASVSYAACAYAQDPSGASLYPAAANQEGGHVRIGPRSLTLAKAFEDSFKPKFATRTQSLTPMRNHFKYGINAIGFNAALPIMTPGGGVVGTFKADGTTTKIAFKGGSVMECVDWRDTNRPNGTNADGSVRYEKSCAQRESVHNEKSAIEVATKYTGGIAPGASVVSVNQFPVIVWKGTKVLAVLGIAVK